MLASGSLFIFFHDFGRGQIFGPPLFERITFLLDTSFLLLTLTKGLWGPHSTLETLGLKYRVVNQDFTRGCEEDKDRV